MGNAPSKAQLRLDRLLGQRGVEGRALARQLIRRGHVAVEGQIVRDGQRKVAVDAEICVRGEPLRVPAPLLKWHKPKGVLTSVGDPWGRTSLEEALPQALAGYHPVGRLDADTTGLLLMSRNGAWTQFLLHPRRAIPRRYAAIVEGGLPGPELVAALAAGVETAEGRFPARVLSLEGQRVVLEITQGRNRIVRRMLNNAGYPVIELQRLAFGPFELGELEAGAWAEPTSLEWAGWDGLTERTEFAR